VEPRDRATVDGLRCTSASRTIIDLAGVLDAESLEAAFESARRRRLVTVASVRGRHDALESRGRAGAARLQRMLDKLDGRAACESVLEVRVARLLRKARLPEPVRQYRVGRYRLDFAWPLLRIALECDGQAFHEFQRDRTRWRELGASGWRVLPVTWRDVEHRWAEVLAELVAALRDDLWTRSGM
jgi:very-short-patch-repair endonuclease